MIAPVLTALDTRKVIIPEGNWNYNGTVYKGPAVIDMVVPLDALPVFEKTK
jgi:alpha-glucosidase (family GH31 glycosyl hydrolase)